MVGAQEQRSEVAHLLLKIRVEYEAAQQGLKGFTYGTSQHEFISARMKNMGEMHTQLQTLVGDVAMGLIVDQLVCLQVLTPVKTGE